RQTAVSRDVEGREPVCVRLGEDQCGVVGRYDHAVRERDAIRHLAGRAVGGDESDDSGGELAAGKVKTDVVDVGVAPTVHDDVVPGVVGEIAQIGVRNDRAIGLPAEQTPIARRDDQQVPLAKPVDTKWKRRHARHDLTPALEITGNQLLSAPVAEPQTPVMTQRTYT